MYGGWNLKQTAETLKQTPYVIFTFKDKGKANDKLVELQTQFPSVIFGIIEHDE